MPRAPSCSASMMSESPACAVSSSVRTGGVNADSSRSAASPGVTGMRQVEQENVGPQVRREPDGVPAVAGFANDAHRGIRFEQLAQRLAKQRMVIGNDDGD